VDLASASEVQRLRRIKQLGVNNLVFPAAEHSRFAHSFGSAYLAVKFCNQVGEAAEHVLGSTNQVGPEDVRAIAISALCHDLGHGPLSHMWEREVIGHRFDRQKWEKALGLDGQPDLGHLDWHELATQSLLAWPEGDIHQRLEHYESGLAERVRAILAGRYWLPYLPTLLRSDIDVDRCDFVARDALNSGVGYGRFKLDWLISTVTIGFEQGQPVIGFERAKSYRSVEQFLIARRALYDTVYQHKTVRSAEGMFGLLLRRLKHLVQSDESPPFSNRSVAQPFVNLFEKEVLAPNDLVKLDDDALWLIVHDLAAQSRGDSTVRDLARRLLGRELFKQVQIEPDEVKELRGSESLRSDLKEVITKVLACEDAEFYFHIDRRVNYMLEAAGSGTPYDRRARFIHSEAEGRPAELVREDEKLRAYAEQEEELRLFVPAEALRAVELFFDRSQ
jgi:HD superfamily phosphohydrolase